MWADNPPVARVMGGTSGLPVGLVLLPVGFCTARVKIPRLSMVSLPNPAHQSPTASSVCLTVGNGEASTPKKVRLSNTGTERTSKIYSDS